MIKDKAALFGHMVRRARRMTADAEILLPSNHLDIAMGDDQARVALNPTPKGYTTGAIMKSAGGSGGTIGLNKRKPDAMGGIRGQSCLLNSEESLERMRMQLDLAMSLSVVKQAEAQAKRAKKEAYGLYECGPAALLKLRKKGNDVAKLFKAEMRAIAHRYFATDLDDKTKVPALVAALQVLIAARPNVLPAVVVEAYAAVVVATAAAVAVGDGAGD